MYAELLPSAQRFISPVLANVNVDVRAMVGPTAAPICNFSSPARTDTVASPQVFLPGVFDDFLLGLLIEEKVDGSNLRAQGPIWRAGASSRASVPSRHAY